MTRFVGLASFACAIVGTEAARYRREGSRSMAGVPVHNYRANAEDWMILLREGATDESLRSICGGKCDFMGHPDEGGTPFIKVHGSESDVEQMVKENADLMEFVEPDTTDYLIPEIEDEESDVGVAAASWGLDAVGVSSKPRNGAGVNIYVQDTGVRSSHTDFGGRSSPAIDLTSNSLVVCSSGSTSCAGDRQGHGTHCAGTTAGNNYGVANGAKVYAVKTLSDQGSGARSWQHAAIDWITASGRLPAVISMSLGGSGADPLYSTSIGAATRRGIVVVVAAGNSNSDACNFSPAFAADAITVGATTSSNYRASYSNYGRCNDIMAPGSSIKSLSSGSNTGTRSLSGTSMACPHVSGGAAILLQANPGAKRSGVMSSMSSNGKRGVIGGLKSQDPDLFLWVGA